MSKTISSTFREMRKQLKENFPPYHYEHLKIWSEFWSLKRRVENNLHGKPDEVRKLKKVI